MEPLATALFSALATDDTQGWFQPHPLTPTEAARLCRQTSQDFHCLVLRGDVPVGYGILRGWEEGFSVPSLGIAIHPDFRRHGWGKQLMHHLHAVAAARGASRIRLRAHPDNLPAQQLYCRFGYRSTGESREQRLFEKPLPVRRCVICRGRLRTRWTGMVLGGRYEAEYCECEHCLALQIADPFWLPEAYLHESLPVAGRADPGRVRRNFSALAIIQALAKAGVIDAGRPLLDVGGGNGLLTRMLRDSGLDAWTYDPFVPESFFAGDHTLDHLAHGGPERFGTITAFEVLEHLTDPPALFSILRQRLMPGGAIVLSTSLYNPGFDSTWFYLAADFGQHVLFWSDTSLRLMAAAAGFASVVQITRGELNIFVISDHSDSQLREALPRAAAIQKNPGFFDEVLGPWRLAQIAPVLPISSLRDTGS